MQIDGFIVLKNAELSAGSAGTPRVAGYRSDCTSDHTSACTSDSPDDLTDECAAGFATGFEGKASRGEARSFYQAPTRVQYSQ